MCQSLSCDQGRETALLCDHGREMAFLTERRALQFQPVQPRDSDIEQNAYFTPPFV